MGSKEGKAGNKQRLDVVMKEGNKRNKEGDRRKRREEIKDIRKGRQKEVYDAGEENI